MAPRPPPLPPPIPPWSRQQPTATQQRQQQHTVPHSYHFSTGIAGQDPHWEGSHNGFQQVRDAGQALTYPRPPAPASGHHSRADHDEEAAFQSYKARWGLNGQEDSSASPGPSNYAASGSRQDSVRSNLARRQLAWQPQKSESSYDPRGTHPDTRSHHEPLTSSGFPSKDFSDPSQASLQNPLGRAAADTGAAWGPPRSHSGPQPYSADVHHVMPRSRTSPTHWRTEPQSNHYPRASRARSRSPTPDPEQEILISGLDPDVKAGKLHEMLDELANSADLAGPSDVVLLRDRQSKSLTGSAIATFSRIADAVRFARAYSPVIGNPEKYFGSLLPAQGDQGATRRPLTLRHCRSLSSNTMQSENPGQTQSTKAVEEKVEPQASAWAGEERAATDDGPPNLAKRSGSSAKHTREKEEKSQTGHAKGQRATTTGEVCGEGKVLSFRRLNPDVVPNDVACALQNLAHMSQDAFACLSGIVVLVRPQGLWQTSDDMDTSCIGFAFFSEGEAAQKTLAAIRATSKFAIRPANMKVNSTRPIKRTLADLTNINGAFVDAVEESTMSQSLQKLVQSPSSRPQTYHDPNMICQIWLRDSKDAPPFLAQDSESVAVDEKKANDKVAGAQREEGSKTQSCAKSPISELRSAQASSSAKQKIALNIANWTKKQGELHRLPSRAANFEATEDAEEGTTGNEANRPEELEAPPSTPPADVPEDFFSDRDLMACYLCSRKFKTVELVGRHERESALHRGNLADPSRRKAGAAAKRQGRSNADGTKPKPAIGPETGFVPIGISANGTDDDTAGVNKPLYRDRALERRQAFGVEVPVKKAKIQRAFEGPQAPDAPTYDLAVPTKTEEAADRGEKLDSSNLGNRMLQSMGWTEGQGIGASGLGMQGPIETVRYAERAGIGSAPTTSATSSASMHKSFLEQARDDRQRRYEEASGEM